MAVAAAAAHATVFVKEKGGPVQLLDGIEIGQPLAAIRRRLREMELSPRSALYLVTRVQLDTFVAGPAAENTEGLVPANDLAPVFDGMCLLAVPPAPPAVAVVGGAGAGAADATTVHASILDLTTRFESLQILSPGKAADTYCHVTRRLLPAPLSVAVEPSVTAAFSRVIQEQDREGWDSIMAEATFYPAATAFLPRWVAADRVDVRRCDVNRSAANVFGPPSTPAGPYGLSLPWACEPELFVRVGKGETPLNGELKTAGDKRAFDGVSAFVMFGIVRSLFDGQPEGTWRFYSRPPAGYGVVGFPYAAHLVAVELVGRLFVSPISKPFVLGSPDHEAAIAALEPIPFGPPMDFNVADMTAAGHLLRENGVLWTRAPASDHMFMKIISATTTWARFDDMYRLYCRYASLSLEGAPAALVRAEMWFGFMCVAIRMPFVGGAHPSHAELSSEPVVTALADAIAWLLRRGILYVDVRPPNVFVEHDHDGRVSAVRLVDYDDAMLQSPPETRAAVERMLTGLTGPVSDSVRSWPLGLRDAVLMRFD